MPSHLFKYCIASIVIMAVCVFLRISRSKTEQYEEEGRRREENCVKQISVIQQFHRGMAICVFLNAMHLKLNYAVNL